MRYAFRAELGATTEAEDAFVARCAAWMEERLAPGGAWRCWVAEAGGEIVGHAWMSFVEKIPNPVDEPELHAYVTNCYVRPEARGKGIGGRLLAAALDACREAGVDAVFLWPSAGSRSLYLRHGFAVRDDLLELHLSENPVGERA
jgi:GNAT superfamily N-acetyltransferase